jgi:tRNA threonylcarbamoyl adenosine modification protein YeaZ
MAVDRSIGAEVAGSQRPLIVAWDTCTTRGVLAVGSGERLLAGEYFESVKGHTGWLMPQMDSTLKDLGLTPSGIDYLAAGIGPGTFTGVKVGVACAKALSFGLDKPLVALPTLDVLAASARPEADVVLSTIDARRGQLYAAVYRQGRDGFLMPERSGGRRPGDLHRFQAAGGRGRTARSTGSCPRRLR